MITLSQRKTFEYIQQYIQQNDYAPTIAEIARGIGIKSRGVVHRYVKALAGAGLIEIVPKRHRNISLIGASNDSIPLVGRVAAGQPIEAIEDQESISMTDIFLGENRYALRVKGDSMIEEGILNDDIVVCERSDTANNGQIVVALIDDQEATLKRLQRNQDASISLLPANATMRPMTYSANRVKVQGIYIGLLRVA
ncbi:MAG: transcriptional repressor LexA [Gammaproteobacteria bacterium]|nr:transcriptional repressor LexA [Gammaproteobacteria bacterium]